MASLRDIRRRIGSVKNTRQITRAMKLVAGAKLRRATDAAVAARPYQRTLSRVLSRVAQSAGDIEHPLLKVPDNDKDVVVVLLTSDRGLCGGFNNQLAKRTQEQVDALIAKGKSVTILAYGKKGLGYFSNRGYTVEKGAIDLLPADYPEAARKLGVRLVDEMTAHKFERVFLAYNDYRSAMSQVPSFEQILPMKLEASAPAPAQAGPAGEAAQLMESLGAANPSAEYLYEPNGLEILSSLLPMALRTQIQQAFLETQAGEQAARMTAMDNATRNAGELINSLSLVYNRARQAAITTELTEIVSGAEAL
mgnify:CR=1 FL=1